MDSSLPTPTHQKPHVIAVCRLGRWYAIQPMPSQWSAQSHAEAYTLLGLSVKAGFSRRTGGWAVVIYPQE
jgi:hypothetical protein